MKESSLTYNNPLTPYVTEEDLQRTVVEMAEHLGWVTWHDNDARKNDAGFPDLVCVHPSHGVLWLELKTNDGEVTPIQRFWLELLQQAGQSAHVIRPTSVDLLERLLHGEAV